MLLDPHEIECDEGYLWDWGGVQTSLARREISPWGPFSVG
jgi:hypothetical protein